MDPIIKKRPTMTLYAVGTFCGSNGVASKAVPEERAATTRGEEKTKALYRTVPYCYTTSRLPFGCSTRWKYSRFGPVACVEAPAAVLAEAEHVTVDHCRTTIIAHARAKSMAEMGAGNGVGLVPV